MDRLEQFKNTVEDLLEVDTVVYFDPDSMRNLFVGLVVSAAVITFLFFYLRKQFS